MGPGGNHQDPAPLWLGQVCAQGAPPSQRLKGCLVPDGKAQASAKKPGPPASLWLAVSKNAEGASQWICLAALALSSLERSG